jgi:hypothetical protein
MQQSADKVRLLMVQTHHSAVMYGEVWDTTKAVKDMSAVQKALRSILALHPRSL